MMYDGSWSLYFPAQHISVVCALNEVIKIGRNAVWNYMDLEVYWNSFHRYVKISVRNEKASLQKHKTWIPSILSDFIYIECWKKFCWNSETFHFLTKVTKLLKGWIKNAWVPTIFVSSSIWSLYLCKSNGLHKESD